VFSIKPDAEALLEHLHKLTQIEHPASVTLEQCLPRLGEKRIIPLLQLPFHLPQMLPAIEFSDSAQHLMLRNDSLFRHIQQDVKVIRKHRPRQHFHPAEGRHLMEDSPKSLTFLLTENVIAIHHPANAMKMADPFHQLPTSRPSHVIKPVKNHCPKQARFSLNYLSLYFSGESP
jgi:hypothetical protein